MGARATPTAATVERVTALVGACDLSELEGERAGAKVEGAEPVLAQMFREYQVDAVRIPSSTQWKSVRKRLARACSPMSMAVDSSQRTGSTQARRGKMARTAPGHRT